MSEKRRASGPLRNRPKKTKGSTRCSVSGFRRDGDSVSVSPKDTKRATCSTHLRSRHTRHTRHTQANTRHASSRGGGVKAGLEVSSGGLRRDGDSVSVLTRTVAALLSIVVKWGEVVLGVAVCVALVVCLCVCSCRVFACVTRFCLTRKRHTQSTDRYPRWWARASRVSVSPKATTRARVKPEGPPAQQPSGQHTHDIRRQQLHETQAAEVVGLKVLCSY